MIRQPSVQQITWFLDLELRKQLNLNPSYQRKSVWTHKDRRFFLDTIFRNFPAPPIFIHKDTDEKGFTTYHIVDGKQRLETIILFSKNKISLDKNFGDEEYNGKKFKQLSSEQKKKFWDYNLAVDFVNIPDDVQVNEIFDRLNRNSRNLNRQELRHARFEGWFISQAEKESEEIFWEEIKVSTRAKAKRMKDVQLISEFFSIVIEKKIVGFDQNYLDNIYAKYEDIDELEVNFDIEVFETEISRIRNYLVEMEKTNSCISDWGSTANNLYILWALIALNKNNLPEPKELAKRYKEFMEEVDKFTESDIDDPDTDTENKYFQYFYNSRGASTDMSQREQRLTSLKTILDE